MASPLDGAQLGFALIAPDAASGQWNIVTSSQVGGKTYLNVNSNGASGGGGSTSSSATQAVIAGSAASVALLAANANRKDATFYNNQGAGGAGSLYLSMGSAASLANFAFRVPPNTMFALPIDYTGAIYGIWDNDAGGNVAVTEFV